MYHDIQNYNYLSGPVSYRDFRETGPWRLKLIPGFLNLEGGARSYPLISSVENLHNLADYTSHVPSTTFLNLNPTMATIINEYRLTIPPPPPLASTSSRLGSTDIQVYHPHT